jgi:O-acetyl-ADP-ribose deacetylase
MRRVVHHLDVDVITEEEAIHSLRIAPAQHVALIGAGVSKEADVPLAAEICADIRDQLMSDLKKDGDSLSSMLNWEDPSRRYASCLENYGAPQDRVDYFRKILHGRRPSFAHHAIALLMATDRLHRDALTTNFDKLLEQAFVAQNIRECQPIRMSEESEFWGPEPDKCYLLKLHGDYDTHNILNTREETRSIPGFFSELTHELLRSRGLMALGCAGNEESTSKFLESLLASREKRFLTRGIRWGVYVGAQKPPHITDEASADAVVAALEAGVIDRRIVEILSDFSKNRNRPCHLFPVWGAGRFLLRLIEQLGDPGLEYTARLYLDHEMRIASLFGSAGIPAKAVDRHLIRLREAQAKLDSLPSADNPTIRKITGFTLAPSGISVEIVYGDIVSRSMLSSYTEPDGRRAIVSTDDTMISAGGGVALSILSAAGRQFMLNEVAKLAPIPHGTVAVTSAGSLPLQYVFHAAALEIDERGEHLATADSVKQVTRDALTKAAALGVTWMFTPLIAAGLAGLSARESLRSILQVTNEFTGMHPGFHLIIVIFDEMIMTRDTATSVALNWRAHVPA